MTDKFAPNSEVFTESGARAEFIAATDDGYVIRPLLREGEDSEPFYGRAYTARRIFAKPPIAVHDAQAAMLLEEIAARSSELQAITAEIRTAKSDRERLLATLKQNEALAHIDDFLAGKYTHFVLTGSSWNWSIDIHDRATALTDPEHKYSGETRLLILTGDRYGKVKWQIGTSSDGVILCMSESEANDIARKLILQEIEADAAKPHHHGDLKKLIETATKFGVPVPATMTTRRRNELLKVHRDQATKARNELAVAETQLAAIEAEAAADA